MVYRFVVVLALLLAAGCGPGNPEPAPLPTVAPTSAGETSTSRGPWTPPATGGTVTIPGPTKAPTSRPPGPTVIPGSHDYGDCPRTPPPGKVVLVGTDGDDVLRGSAKDEYICGLGGNDTIQGGGGKDNIWGGPGDDVISGGPLTDFLYGGDGNDLLKGLNTGPDSGYDYLWGDSPKPTFDDSGDDVLLGGTLSTGEKLDGGPGNDALMPTAVRTFPNYLNAGEGSDVVVALNFSRGGNVDLIDLNGVYDVSIPLGTSCSVQTQLDYTEPASTGSVSCDLPWPGRLSGLKDILPISASLDSEGRLTFDTTLYQGLGKLSVSGWRNLVSWQASLGDDACVCDPLTKTPAHHSQPYDYPS